MYVFIENNVAFYREYRREGGVQIGPLVVSKTAKKCEKSANYIKEHLELPDCNGDVCVPTGSTKRQHQD